MTDPAFLALLIDALAKTIPDDPDQSAAGRAASLAMARTLLEAWEPADAMGAALAARAIAGHLAAMDSFARAAKPGVSDEKAVRLRVNAIAAGRMFDRQLQAFRRQRQPAVAPPPITNVPAAATRTPHRADPPLPAPAVPAAVMQATRRAALCSETALVAIRPTILAPA
jgi:hypothetical protein